MSRPQIEVAVRHHHDHREVLHLRVQLQKSEGLGIQPMLEPRLAVHLLLQQHHWTLRRAGFTAPWPEHAIEAVVQRLEFGGIKAIQRIA